MHLDTRVDSILNYFELVRGLHRQGYLDGEELARDSTAVVVWSRLAGHTPASECSFVRGNWSGREG